MMMFKPMSIKEAKEFYEKLKAEGKRIGKYEPILDIAMDDIWFFTDGLTKDYGGNGNGKEDTDSFDG